MEPKEKSSVYIAVFTLDERDGWASSGILQFAVGLSSARRKLCLQVKQNAKHVDYARNLVVRDFLQSGFEWLLLIDNDMHPPTNLLDMIDRAEPHMSILAPKFYLLGPCLAEHAQNPQLPLTLGWQPLNARPDEREWCELAWTGTGVMCVRREVFVRMDEPYFRFVYDVDGRQMNSEDVNFCQKARRAGFSVWGNQAFEADHFKTISLSALARSMRAIVPSPLRDLLARGVSVTGETPATPKG